MIFPIHAITPRISGECLNWFLVPGSWFLFWFCSWASWGPVRDETAGQYQDAGVGKATEWTDGWRGGWRHEARMFRSLMQLSTGFLRLAMPSEVCRWRLLL